MTVPTSDPATTLNINRTFTAPRELVFSAWTEPERLKRWWGAHEGFTTPIAEIDLRVGGSYRLGMKPPDQNIIFVVGGVYREIQPPAKLVYTWVWQPPLNSETMQPSAEHPPEMDNMAVPTETLVTVEFHAQGNSTELVLTHEYFADQHSRDEHNGGWNGTFDRLAKLIESGEL